jgi:hypothetical protein
MQETGEIELGDYVEEDRTEVKDKEGNVIKWKEEGEWKKTGKAKKGPRGRVTNLSDKARRETEKMSTTKEDFDQFESWANSVVEGTIEPDTLAALQDLLTQGITVGTDGTQAIQALQGIGIHNEQLEALIKAKAGIDPNTELSNPLGEWLSIEDPEAATELGLVASAEPAQEEPAPVAPEAPVAPAEQPVGEGREFGAFFYEQLAQKLFDIDPNLSTKGYSEELLDAGWTIAAKDPRIGPKKADRMFMQGSDFLDDFVSAYAWLQHNLHSSNDPHDPDDPAPMESPEDDETMTNAEPVQEKPNIREIAEVVKSFYDKETGKFPKGETGVVIHCKKMFGDHGGQLAERLVAHLSQQVQEREQTEVSQQQFEDIKKLAGVGKKVVGAVKKFGSKALDTLGHGDDEQMIKDLQKKMGVPQTGKPSMAQTNEEFDVIMKLARMK